MHVTLIRPPAVYRVGGFKAGAAIPPIGVAYLAAALEGAGHAVKCIDGIGSAIDHFYRVGGRAFVVNGLTLPEILSRIPASTDLIGVSCMFSSEWFYDDAMIRAIREAFPGIPIAVGGEHVTAEWMNILRTCPAIDYCVLGEGEETLLELLDALRLGKDPSVVPGLSFRKDGVPVKTPSRERKTKLDDLPLPAWHHLPVAEYVRRGNSMTTINRKSIPILASRGCPFSCTFCTAPQMWGNELYLRSPKSVLQEIKSYIVAYGIEHVDFLDIVGVMNRRWTEELLSLMAGEPLGISWLHGAGTRSEILDDRILDLFKQSNALRVFFAPESGSATTLKRIKKRVNLDKMVNSMRKANALGLSMRAPLIFGFPGQTLKEVFESFRFALRMTWIGVDDVVVHAYSAYPGSEYYRELVASGKIDIEKLIAEGKYNDFMSGGVIDGIWGMESWSAHIPNWMLPVLQFGVMGTHYLLGFALRPWRLYRSLKRSLFERKPLTLFDHVLYRVFVESRFPVK